MKVLGVCGLNSFKKVFSQPTWPMSGLYHQRISYVIDAENLQQKVLDQILCPMPTPFGDVKSPMYVSFAERVLVNVHVVQGP